MTTTLSQPDGVGLDGELSASERELLVRSAILAPSIHNTQPWRFRFRHRTIEVHRDLSRELPADDPDGRMAMIGVGAAVFNLRVAAATLARTTITVLLPDPGRRALAAEVTLGAGPGVGTELAGMFLNLRPRRTNRHAFSNRPIPAAVRRDLEEAAAAEGARLSWASREQVHRLQRVASAVAAADDPSSPVRTLDGGPVERLRGTARFERHPTLAVLATRQDSPGEWLAAGQALQRVLLVATHHELATSLLNQPVDHTEFRQLLRDPDDGWNATQVVLRLGYGLTVPPTPRRPFEDFVLDDTNATEPHR